MASKNAARKIGGVATRVTSETRPVRPAAIREKSRVVYPYSVIRGGAYSAAELQQAVRTDPVVAAHYAGFDPARTTLVQAPAGTSAYVSYRKGDRVLWTRRKLRLGAQETLLSDGEHEARARCGNRISFVPQGPTDPNEPLGPDFDFPEPPPVTDPAMPDVGLPEIFSGPLLAHEIFPPLIPNGIPATVSATGGDGGTAPAYVLAAATGGLPAPPIHGPGLLLPPNPSPPPPSEPLPPAPTTQDWEIGVSTSSAGAPQPRPTPVWWLPPGAIATGGAEKTSTSPTVDSGGTPPSPPGGGTPPPPGPVMMPMPGTSSTPSGGDPSGGGTSNPPGALPDTNGPITPARLTDLPEPGTLLLLLGGVGLLAHRHLRNSWGRSPDLRGTPTSRCSAPCRATSVSE